jgi:hypothetical protein
MKQRTQNPLIYCRIQCARNTHYIGISANTRVFSRLTGRVSKLIYAQATTANGMPVMAHITFNDCLERHADMERAAKIADVTGDESGFEQASDINLDLWYWLMENGTDTDKATARAFMIDHYGWDD